MIKLKSLILLACFVLVPAVHAASLPDFTDLVEEASPAVVNISTTRSVGGGSANPFGQNPNLEELPEFFRRFFGEQFQAPPGTPGVPREARSAGSGFIVSDGGYILTNNHVVEGADEIYVRLSDRSELQAELVGADPNSDLALLKVDNGNLPSVRMGKSSDLEVGEWVVAIGAPFGFDYSVTAGIVSAMGRSLPSESYVPFIQTDVAINPGNSGGPLFNLDGEVVGINSQIYTRSGGFMGLSFAIPIDVAMDVVQQLKEHGKVRRGWLGVLIQEVSKDLAESFDLDKPRGALVAQILENSPAADTDLKVGDVIISYNGHPINFSYELPPQVGRTKPGETVELEVVRQGREKTIEIEIGELPGEDGTVAKAEKSGPQHGSTLNMALRNLEPDEARDLGIDHGVRVEQVYEGPAAEAGIRRGDVISSIDNKAIKSVSQLRDLAKELPRDKALPVLVMRDGNPVFVVIKISD